MDAHTMTLATQMAVRELKREARDTGKRERDIRISDLRKPATRPGDHRTRGKPDRITSGVLQNSKHLHRNRSAEIADEFLCRTHVRKGANDRWICEMLYGATRR